ncbi:MAG: hypothetical protein DHS20C20_09660 [Ardenticatenaceae bacterium]|nr:MAG: hypothetical protein DHS20C20_09660 [Ardenticatenaceae bacterium]
MYQVNPTKSIETVWNVFRAGLSSRRETAVIIPHAVQAAYQEFQQTHPEWANSLFDGTFLCQDAAPLFANGKLPNAKQLAKAWRSQFKVGTSAQKDADIRKVQPVAAIFLQMVRQELHQ